MRSLQEIDADIAKVQALINSKEAQRQSALSDPYAVSENSPANRAAVFDYIVEGDRSGIDVLMQQRLSAALQKKSAEEAKSENQNRAMKQWQDALAVVQDLDTRSTRGEVVSAKDKALAKNALSYAEKEMQRVGLGDYLKVPEAPVAEKKAEVVVAEAPKGKTEAELYEDIKAYMQNPQEVIPDDITTALDTLEKSEGGIYRDYAKSTREQANKSSADLKEKRESKEKQKAAEAKQEAADKESNELKTLSSKADDPNITLDALKGLRKDAEKYGESQTRQDLLNKIDKKIKSKTPKAENPLFAKGKSKLTKFDPRFKGESGTLTDEVDGHTVEWSYKKNGNNFVVTPSSIDGKKATGKPFVLTK